MIYHRTDGVPALCYKILKQTQIKFSSFSSNKPQNKLKQTPIKSNKPTTQTNTQFFGWAGSLAQSYSLS